MLRACNTLLPDVECGRRTGDAGRAAARRGGRRAAMERAIEDSASSNARGAPVRAALLLRYIVASEHTVQILLYSI